MTVLGKPFDIEIYRSFKYNYTNGVQHQSLSNICDCHCDASKCEGVDKLFLYSQKAAALENYYDKWVKGRMGFEESSNTFEKPKTKDGGDPSAFVKDIFVQVDYSNETYNDDNVESTSKYYKSEYSSECKICQQIRDTLDTHKSEIFAKLNGLNTAYNTKHKKHTDELDTQIANITTQQSIFSDNTKQIQQLQKKIRLAHDLLNAQATKLKTFGESLNSLQAQYKERGVDRVVIGIPYFPPFFTMSSRNFLIMMICLMLILIVVIFVYGFYGSIKHTADVERIEQPSQPNDAYQNANYL